jgi:ABC transporter substrate binding protein
MRRREFVGLVGGGVAGLSGLLGSPAVAHGQQPQKQRRLAFVHSGIPADSLTESDGPFWVRRFHESLRGFGDVEGQNLVIERYSAEGHSDRFAALAAEVVSRNHRARIAELALRRALPTIFDVRDYVEAGGLASYGSDYFNVMELTGTYAGRVLKGEKPADLPMQQATKFELVINRKTANALDIEISPTLLATADDVID